MVLAPPLPSLCSFERRVCLPAAASADDDDADGDGEGESESASSPGVLLVGGARVGLLLWVVVLLGCCVLV